MLSAEFYRITQSFAEDCGKVHKTLVDELNESAEAGLGLKPTYKFGRAGISNAPRGNPRGVQSRLLRASDLVGAFIEKENPYTIQAIHDVFSRIHRPP